MTHASINASGRDVAVPAKPASVTTIPSLAAVRDGLRRSGRYAFDDRPYVLTGMAGDEFVLLVAEKGRHILTRPVADGWAGLPNVEWIRSMTARGRFRPLDAAGEGARAGDREPLRPDLGAQAVDRSPSSPAHRVRTLEPID